MISILLGLMLTVGLFSFSPVSAVKDDLLGLQYAQESGLTDTDVRTTAANLINVALGVLGTILLVLIVYAGFLWMTAAGQEDNITKAKGILSASVIGLVIILSAYAISSFVVKETYKATTGEPEYVVPELVPEG
jgi:uncharacterized membrane protein